MSYVRSLETVRSGIAAVSTIAGKPGHSKTLTDTLPQLSNTANDLSYYFKAGSGPWVHARAAAEDLSRAADDHRLANKIPQNEQYRNSVLDGVKHAALHVELLPKTG